MAVGLFVRRRLRGASHAYAHVLAMLAMLATSATIPLLSEYRRLRGAWHSECGYPEGPFSSGHTRPPCANTARRHLPAMWKRLTVLWVLVRGDARRLWFALRHPATPGWFKGANLLLLIYLVSPIDLLPDALPVIGVVDDLVLLPLAVHWLLSRLPTGLRAELDRRFGAGPGSARPGR